MIPWLGFAVNTNISVVRIEGKTLSKGMKLRQEIFGLRPDTTAPARSLLSSAASLSSTQGIGPGGRCHLRRGGNVVNDSRIMATWRPGDARADSQSGVTEELRRDMLRWRKGLGSRGAQGLHFADHWGFVLRPRSRGLRDKALSIGSEAACAVYVDAAGSRGWGASLGDSCIQGVWSEVAMREGVNWQELRVLTEAPSQWRIHVRRKLVLVRLDDAAAVAYGNHGAGRSSQLTRLAREMKEH